MDYDHGYITKLDLYKENFHGKKMALIFQNLGPQHCLPLSMLNIYLS